MKKFQGLEKYLTEKGLIHPDNVIAPSMVDMANLMTVHTQRYSSGIMTGELDDRELRTLGLPWSKGLAVRSRLAVQGTINAALMALQDGIAGNLAGGTHHAMAD